jgi:hypothetical protein
LIEEEKDGGDVKISVDNELERDASIKRKSSMENRNGGDAEPTVEDDEAEVDEATG